MYQIYKSWVMAKTSKFCNLQMIIISFLKICVCILVYVYSHKGNIDISSRLKESSWA